MLLNDDQRMLADLAARLFTDKADPDTVRAIRDGRIDSGYDQTLWQAMGEAGLTGILVPEAHGGMDFGLVGAGLVAREAGRRLAMTPYVSSAVLAATALGAADDDDLRARWLPGIADASAIATLACDEGRHHRPHDLATRAEAGGDDGWHLQGEKTLVNDAAQADLLLVSAHDGDGPRLFAVEAGAAGLTIESTQLLDSRSCARITLEHTPAQPLGAGRPALDASLRAGRAVLAAELVGIAREVFARTLGYLHERRQFGRAIGSFQALQHRAAHLSVEIEMAEALAFRALEACDRDEPGADALVPAAKAKAAAVARLTAAEGVQMHGGMGMTDEFDIGLFMKRARAAGHALGDYRYCTDAFARARGY
ncbi:acyl-CoA dehydrogenase family protein [Salinisphaera orenii]|uniref:Acyl-CoA dehydrogenase n=1 Tax=Salinisphaera orenii YIM 95161 TaxID=1051139 RepID=A0A423PYX3_9GAMM|nr:acyl-CoA dehydrogenase family protein [Salinisphaera halophila]ROO30804.1 acyl-CoA dehydrogenase [Salinisphaera halophila YIM 95161]